MGVIVVVVVVVVVVGGPAAVVVEGLWKRRCGEAKICEEGEIFGSL